MLLFFSCNPDSVISEIPEISLGSVTVYKNIAQKDSMIVLSINYKDGDGDIGLEAGDTIPPFNYKSEGYYNLLVTYKIKEGNDWKKIVISGSSDTLNFNQRFERLNKSDKSRAVSGTIDLRIPASPYPGIFPDTIKLSCQMLDRKMNKSSIVESTEIKLKH